MACALFLDPWAASLSYILGATWSVAFQPTLATTNLCPTDTSGLQANSSDSGDGMVTRLTGETEEADLHFARPSLPTAPARSKSAGPLSTPAERSVEKRVLVLSCVCLCWRY